MQTEQDNKDEGRLLLNRWTLSFRTPEIERDFARKSLNSSLLFIRLYLIFGIGLYFLFGILDTITIPNNYLPIWAIRYLYVCPITAFILFLTFHPVFYRISHTALTVVMVVASSGIIAMTVVMDSPFKDQYYAGLLLVVIYCGSMLGFRLIHNVIVTIFICISYALACTVLAPIPTENAISNLFFLVSAGGFGIFSNYVLETFVRRSYVAEYKVERQNERLQFLLHEAEAANLAKSEFLAVMSHELRTPLNAIIGFSEILTNQIAGPLGSPKYLEYAGDIHSSGIHLLSIINDILDLAKAESGKLEIIDDEVPLDDLADACIRMCAPKAEECGVTLTLQIPDNITLIVDERLMRQVLLNLLSNAIKFTPKGGKVIVSAEQTEQDLKIRVQDTGVGIPQKDIGRILRPFEQVESAHSRRHGGTGLGLPYSKKLVELHGGMLTLSSTQNVGTTVDIVLPPNRFVITPLASGESARSAM